jgi:biotin-(acetyl-CoA carboxylase) ligase
LDDLTKEIALNIIKNIKKLKGNGFGCFIDILNEKLAFKNEKKTIIDGEKRITGLILGVGENGELLLKTGNEILKFISGEISFEK